MVLKSVVGGWKCPSPCRHHLLVISCNKQGIGLGGLNTILEGVWCSTYASLDA